jgi:hypothetical protein
MQAHYNIFFLSFLRVFAPLRAILSLFLFVGFGLSSFAQTAILEGTIFDDEKWKRIKEE